MILRHKLGFVFLLFYTSFLFSCHNSNSKEVTRDTTITEENAFNNLFLDSTIIQQFLQQHNEYTSFEKQIFDFYQQRNFEFAWFDSSGFAEPAANFMNLLSSTIQQLNDSSLYNKKLNELYTRLSTDSISIKKDKKDIQQTELYLTAQFFQYASKIYEGGNIDATTIGWYIPKKKYNPVLMLDSVIASKNKQKKYLILHPQFEALFKSLNEYNTIAKNNVWDSIALIKKALRQGDSAAIISQVKKRLFILHDWNDKDTSHIFTPALTTAVQQFQKRMGLAINGTIDRNTLQELNVSPSERIKQILINIERMRWLPVEADSNFIFVNIPAFTLYVFDSGKLQFDMKVIVGKESTGTVIFTGNLKYIVFSPYWNIPASIVRKEILPAMNRNASYLKRNNMEITGYSNGLPVIRQRPGPANSLGLIKFIFPNNYNIYLHDTPNKNLFSLSTRTISHGCIRIEQPKKLALYLLRDDSTYTPEKIDSLMHLSSEKWVALKKPVLTFIAYLTAWVDRDGKLNFRKDIYGHDKKMAEKMFQ